MDDPPPKPPGLPGAGASPPKPPKGGAKKGGGAEGGGGAKGGLGGESEVPAEFAALVTAEQHEANLKAEMTVVLRQRDLQSGAAAGRAAALGRVAAGVARNRGAKELEGVWMVDEVRSTGDWLLLRVISAPAAAQRLFFF